MDFNALQHKLFELDPSDPKEDLRKLAESASGNVQKSATDDVNYVQESVEVQEGSLEMDRNYSIADFAALAGVQVNEGMFDKVKGMASYAKNQIKHGMDNQGSINSLKSGNPSNQQTKVKGTVNPQKLVSDLGVSNPKLLVTAIQKTKTGKQLTRMEQVSMAEAFQRLMQMDPSQTQTVMMQLKRMELDQPENESTVETFEHNHSSKIKNEDFKNDHSPESIKEMLYRKLREK